MFSFIFLLFFNKAFTNDQQVISVGSKKFTESVILGEIAKLSLIHKGLKAEHKSELGGTRILWNALLNGDIDLYPEYTGTIAEEILKSKIINFADLQSELSKFGIAALPPLGFNNTYAIGMKKNEAEKLGIQKISDLIRFPDIKIGCGDEFRLRPDGWQGLKKRYGLSQKFVRGMDHDIAYRALENGDIQLTDLYSTDAEIAYYDLKVLEDDLNFFPHYEALFLYRIDTAQKYPTLLEAISPLSGSISESKMIAMNRKAKIDKISSSEVAAAYLSENQNIKSEVKIATRSERLIQRTKEHLFLVFVSLFFSILVAIPLGVMADRWTNLGRYIMWAVGIIQTIPALALLVILIRPLNWVGLSGIGDTPALIALFLYSLLPVVRSTHSGFQQIPFVLRETASVLGLRESTKLFRIEFPLAMPSILSGIKTASVMSVGFATIGALVGAGGYGQSILTGVRLDDYGLILEGAMPAAILALIVQYLFDAIEKKIVSPGLTLRNK